MKRSNIRKMERRCVGGIGQMDTPPRAFEMIRAVAKIDRMGRMVKLYRKPSRHRRAPNSVT